MKFLQYFFSGFAVVFSFGTNVPKIKKTDSNIYKYWQKTADHINTSFNEYLTKQAK